jgi:uncharacterized protein (TIGR02391 family)
MFFDDLVLLRTVDRLERDGHTGELNSATNLLNQVTESQPVVDDRDLALFLREMEMAQECGYIDFRVMGWGVESASVQQMGLRNYLGQMTDIHLLPPGRDRARCRVFEQEPPDPGEDDGSPIDQLTLARIAAVIAPRYTPEQLGLFLESGGIARELIPDPAEPESRLRELFGGLDGPAQHRRMLRTFIGLWLAQGLQTGPNADEEAELLADLGRQGWFVRDDRLVRGEPIRRATVAPLLGGDLLVNFHPKVQAAARAEWERGSRAAAIFNAFKAVEIRTRELVGGESSGHKLMSDAFGGVEPRLRLNSGVELVDRDEQEGFKLIFMGAMTGVRNPNAHALFDDLDERRGLDYLGFASLLMRRLDDAGELGGLIGLDR